MKENLGIQGKSWEIVTQPKGFVGEVFLMILSNVFPLLSGMYLQKTASKSLLEMLQNTPNMLQKISVFTHKFYIEKSELKIYVFDLSKRVLATENEVK